MKLQNRINQSFLLSNLLIQCAVILFVQGLDQHPFNEVLHHRHSLKEFLLDHVQSEINAKKETNGFSKRNINDVTGFGVRKYVGSPSVLPTVTPSISPTLVPTQMPTTFSPSTFSPSTTSLPTKMPFVKLRDDDDDNNDDDWHPTGFTDDETIPPFWLYITRFDSSNCNETHVVATSGLHSGACIKDDSYNDFASFILRGASCEDIEIDIFADNNCTNFLYNKFLRNAIASTLGTCYSENATAGAGNDAYTRRIDCSMTSTLPILTRSVVKLMHGYGSAATCSASPIEFTAISSNVCFSENGGYSEQYSCNLDSPVDLKYFGSNSFCGTGASVHSDVNISFHQGCYTNGHYNGNHVPHLRDDIKTSDSQGMSSKGLQHNYRDAEASLAAALRHEDAFQSYNRDHGSLQNGKSSSIIKQSNKLTTEEGILHHRSLEAVSVFKNTVDNDDTYANTDDQYGDDGVYSDEDSHDVFYADDNFDDAYGFDDDAALNNKLHETLHCFQLESYAPTVRPTMRPSKSRSPSVMPTVQVLPIISFDLSISMTGLLNTTLDDMSVLTLKRTVGYVLNISEGASTFVELFNVTTRTIGGGRLDGFSGGRRDLLVSSVDVAAVAKMRCVLDLQLYDNPDPQMFYDSLGNHLRNITLFTSMLRSIADSVGAQTIDVSTATETVLQGPLSIQLPPTMQPTIAPTNAPTFSPSSKPASPWTADIISGVAIGSFVLLLCCSAGVYFFGYYGPRERPRVVALTDHHLV